MSVYFYVVILQALPNELKMLIVPCNHRILTRHQVKMIFSVIKHNTEILKVFISLSYREFYVIFDIFLCFRWVPGFCSSQFRCLRNCFITASSKSFKVSLENRIFKIGEKGYYSKTVGRTKVLCIVTFYLFIFFYCCKIILKIHRS